MQKKPHLQTVLLLCLAGTALAGSVNGQDKNDPKEQAAHMLHTCRTTDGNGKAVGIMSGQTINVGSRKITCVWKDVHPIVDNRPAS